MLQKETAGDYVIATGVTASVRDFCKIAFSSVGLRASDHITVDPTRMWPAEVDVVRGDARKAKEKLGWQAEIILRELIRGNGRCRHCQA